VGVGKSPEMKRLQGFDYQEKEGLWDVDLRNDVREDIQTLLIS